MKPFVVRSALPAITMMAFCFACSVHAQLLLDQGKNLLGSSGGGTAGLAAALPLDQIIRLLQNQGYSNITGLAPSPSGDTLQASAVNSSGTAVDLLINPVSGGVISALPK